MRGDVVVVVLIGASTKPGSPYAAGQSSVISMTTDITALAVRTVSKVAKSVAVRTWEIGKAVAEILQLIGSPLQCFAWRQTGF